MNFVLTCLLRETTSMIDLSHLTEEEQDAIMTVLQRDAQLKKAEEERVRYLIALLLTKQIQKHDFVGGVKTLL